VTLWFQIVEEAERVEVALGGDLDEHADFGELRGQLHGDVALVLSEVRRINSCGVREWVNFMRELDTDERIVSLELHACSPAMVNQLNTISNFRGSARVRSLLAPYVCERCDIEQTRLVEVAPVPTETALPAFPGPRCGEPMEFDDLPERYLSFLKEQ
jgi:hypothetical protein